MPAPWLHSAEFKGNWTIDVESAYGLSVVPVVIVHGINTNAPWYDDPPMAILFRNGWGGVLPGEAMPFACQTETGRS